MIPSRTGAILGITALVSTCITGCANDPPSAAVGIEVRGCDPGIEHGSGMIVDTDIGPLVLTSAHVVKGARSITVTRGDERAQATVVAFDPEMDLAHLAVDELATPFPWAVDSTAITGGEVGSAYVVRDGRVVTLPVTVVRRINIRTEDIYIDGETLKPGYELRVDIDPGDSGGAVVVDGEVIGVVWARSRRDVDRAYGIDPDRAGTTITRQLRTGDLTGVDLTRCS
ncbi:MAG: trypsin-like peptidase domain-containing protein [Ilumatobacteraceae bacterium]